jgi:hypothetical protein
VVQLPLVLLGSLFWDQKTFDQQMEKVYKNIPRVGGD